jgi:uncharacterized phage-associated protein
MKMQKLLFYAYAWFLAIKDRRLFSEPVQAWPWGPVIPPIYSETRPYGRSPITGPLRIFAKTGDGAFDFNFIVPETPDEETAGFIKDIWQSLKQYSGVQLSNATHLNGEPWAIVKSRMGELSTKPIIPDDIIRSVFKAKLSADAQ